MISCITVPPAEVNITVKPVSFPVPLPPDLPEVEFINNGEGLFLSYDDGRKLAKWINDIKSYKEKLEEIIDYYKTTPE